MTEFSMEIFPKYKANKAPVSFLAVLFVKCESLMVTTASPSSNTPPPSLALLNKKTESETSTLAECRTQTPPPLAPAVLLINLQEVISARLPAMYAPPANKALFPETRQVLLRTV